MDARLTHLWFAGRPRSRCGLEAFGPVAERALGRPFAVALPVELALERAQSERPNLLCFVEPQFLADPD